MGDISGLLPESELQSTLPSLPVPNPTRSFWHISHPNDLVKHRTTPTLPKHASVVIIGSGISGAFAARELILNASMKDVVVLEARDICSGATGRVSHATSYASGGINCPITRMLADCLRTADIAKHSSTTLSQKLRSLNCGISPFYHSISKIHRSRAISSNSTLEAVTRTTRRSSSRR